LTRRAPPLEIHSRQESTRRSVHRSIGRWAVLLSIGALALTACKALPEYRFARDLKLSRSGKVDLVSPDGMVSRAARARITRKLANTGDTDLLDYHLAAMQEIGAPPLLTGNAVELLIDGPSTYRAMFSAIEAAKEFVFVESFIFEDAVEGERRLSVLLGEAARRGVKVHVLYDAVGSLGTKQEFLDGLKAAGISLCVFNPLNPLDQRFSGINQRDHRKIMVVDGVVAFTGGINFSRAYRLTSTQVKRRALDQEQALASGWRDTHIGIRGTGATELERHFRDSWKRAECRGTALPAFRDVARNEGTTLVQIVASTPDDETNVIYATMLSVISYAQRNIDITMAYFVPDDALEKALKDAAKRGVKVRIIVPSYSDFSGVFYAGRAHYDELLAAGVELYELENAFLHSKSIAVDGVWSSIGSTNFDLRSFVHNDEISVCVIDLGFAKTMDAAFVKDLGDSKQITRAAWKKRGLKERFKELLWLPIQYWL
jgi:cardiolipin synthase A/B